MKIALQLKEQSLIKNDNYYWFFKDYERCGKNDVLNPCKNAAACSWIASYGGSYECKCRGGWTGKLTS